MQMVIRSTDQVTEIDGVQVRVWEGRTSSGIACKVLVHRIAVHEDADWAEFERELIPKAPPSLTSAIHEVLQ